MASAPIPGTVVTAALRAVKAEEGGDEEAELRQLLEESQGKGRDGKPFYRYAYAAADYLFSNPDAVAEGEDGVTFVRIIDPVVALLRRQIRLDASAEAEIPAALSAQKLLDEVLASSGQASGRRKATLQAI